MRFPGFLGGSNTSQSLIADAEKTVNLYMEPIESANATSPAALMPTPGFRAWSADGVSAVVSRGSLVADGRLFWVIGGQLCEFSNTGIPTIRGAIAQDSSPAQLIWNGKVGGQIGIASGGSVYSYDLASNVLSAAVLGGGYTHLCYVKGYGLALNPSTGKVNLSNLNNLSVFDAGQFFQRSQFADPWQAMWADASGLVWLVGTETFEVWSLSNPASTQPFAPVSGLAGRFGIAAPFAYGVSGAGILWLARNGPEGGVSPVWTQGGVPVGIGSYSVNGALAATLRTTTLSDAELLVYFDAGHTFANLSLPSASQTWTVDVKTRSWTERGRWNPALGRYDLWSPRMHADCFGKHLIGDRTSGRIYEMSTDLATEIDGSGIRRLRRTPGTTNEHKRIPLSQFELLMDVGIAGQGIDPQVMLRISSDGGRTWSNEQRCGSGRIGEYFRRVYWTRLGAPADFVAEVTWSDPVPVRVIDAFVNNAEQVAA